MTTLENLTAKIEIKEVLDEFANLEINVPAQMALFTEDAHVRIHMAGKLAMEMNSRAETEKAFSAFTGAVKASQHLNGQAVITVDEDGQTATAVSACHATLVMDEDGQTVIVNHSIYYNDTFKKVDGNWLIAERSSNFVISDKRSFDA